MTRTTRLALAFTLLAGSVNAQTFSLDDNPSAPLTSAPFAGLFSAEDPFGLFLPPVPAGRIGPSPTLITASGITYTDGDVLTVIAGGPPEPVLDIGAPARSYLDALSADHERLGPDQAQELFIRFSVDRATSGLPGTALERQFLLNQQPGDIFISERAFPHPAIFVGTLGGGFSGVLPSAAPGGIGSNQLEFDESRFFLTAGLGPGSFISPALPAPPITPGEHDNVDAFNLFPERTLDVDGDLVTDVDTFLSVPPAEAFLLGVSAADIFIVPKGATGIVPAPWAPGFFMGLDSFGFPPNPQIEQLDDVDALVVWDIGEPNPDQVRAEPGRDFALFSLSEASASLAAIRATGLPVDGSTVFFTDFTGSFAVYAFGENVGVLPLQFNDIHANIDALEVFAELNPCDPCVLADVNGDGVVDPSDFTAWVVAYNNGDPAADQNCDGVIDPSDFTAWVVNYNACA
ncbi:MAG: GC-type dockerin domain-anchored protein [Phycisphaerales bacterium]